MDILTRLLKKMRVIRPTQSPELVGRQKRLRAVQAAIRQVIRLSRRHRWISNKNRLRLDRLTHYIERESILIHALRNGQKRIVLLLDELVAPLNSTEELPVGYPHSNTTRWMAEHQNLELDILLRHAESLRRIPWDSFCSPVPHRWGWLHADDIPLPSRRRTDK